MVQRIPIKVDRTPIKLPTELRAQLKLLELQEETRYEDIVAITEHYNMLMCQATKKTGYTVVGVGDPQGHKNWVHFEYVYEICRMQQWDARLYLEAQFDRGKRGYLGRYRQPFANMLYSDAALRYFTNYLATIRKTYKKDVGKRQKERGSVTQSVRELVITGIISSAEALSNYLGHTKDPNSGQFKAIRIFQSWGEYSPYYLWSIPWFHKVMNDLPEGKKLDECRSVFDQIYRARSLQELIETTTRAVEKEFGIPDNIEL